MNTLPSPHTDSPLRSTHTTNFPQLLHQLGISLLVTTYQAGKLVIVRPDPEQPELLNTHFCAYAKPMGVAHTAGRLAIGTTRGITELRDVPALAARCTPRHAYDACFVPRNSHVTGDIQIHEMAYGGDQLWFVNTVFSCLCTRDPEYSFVPRWRPPFVTELSPEDRCHLNGLAMQGNEPRWLTALGTTDHAGGWRENKRNGGVLIDMKSDAVVASGLSMPHSPRWYQDRLWIAESGTGSVGTISMDSGCYLPLATLAGFTRGLDFFGPFAFVGLSQVRESAIFSGIPITSQGSAADRMCGVVVLDIRSGQQVASLKFEDGVQEIFGLVVLPGIRYPHVIHDEVALMDSTYVLPDEALAAVPRPLRVDGRELGT